MQIECDTQLAAGKIDDAEKLYVRAFFLDAPPDDYFERSYKVTNSQLPHALEVRSASKPAEQVATVEEVAAITDE